MRKGFFAFSALIGLSIIATSTALAQQPCTGATPQVYFQPMGGKPTTAGFLNVADDMLSVFVGTRNSASYRGWKLSESISQMPNHAFGATDRDRIDAAAHGQATILLTRNDGSQCTLVTYLTLLQSVGKDALFVAPESGTSSFTLGELPLFSSVSLQDVYGYESVENGKRQLHLHARVDIAKVSSATDADLIVSANTYTLQTTSNGLAFFIAPQGIAQSEPYEFDLQTMSCRSVGRECDARGVLKFPGASSNRLDAALQSNGHALFTAANPESPPCWEPGFIGINKLCVTSADIDFNAAAVQLTGNASMGGTRIDMISLGFTRVQTYDQHGTLQSHIVPRGEFSLNDVDLNDGVKLHHVHGVMRADGSGMQLTADAHLALPLQNGTTNLAVDVNNLVVNTRFGQNAILGKFTLDFSGVQVVPDPRSVLFDHALAACPDKGNVTLPMDDVPQYTFCLGIHLNTGPPVDDSDVARGYISLAPPDDNHPAFHVSALNLRLPKGKPVPVHVGIGTLNFSSVDIYDPAVSTDPAYPPVDTLAQPASVMDFSDAFPEGINDVASGQAASWPRDKCSRMQLVAQATVSGITVNGTTHQLDSEPRIGFGESCTVFDLQGGLPLQLGENSSVQVTSLTVARAMDSGQTLYYLRASGSFTTGNIVVFFDSLGYRTLLPPKDSKHNLHDICERKEDEYNMSTGNTRGCIIWRPNMPMTAAATIAKNGPQIQETLNKALSALGGFILRAIKW